MSIVRECVGPARKSPSLLVARSSVRSKRAHDDQSSFNIVQQTNISSDVGVLLPERRGRGHVRPARYSPKLYLLGWDSVRPARTHADQSLNKFQQIINFLDVGSSFSMGRKSVGPARDGFSSPMGWSSVRPARDGD